LQGIAVTWQIESIPHQGRNRYYNRFPLLLRISVNSNIVIGFSTSSGTPFPLASQWTWILSSCSAWTRW